MVVLLTEPHRRTATYWRGTITLPVGRSRGWTI